MTRNKQGVLLSFWISAVALVALVAASYAWMSISGTLRVTNLTLNIITDSQFELALDEEGEPGEWTASLQVPQFMAEGKVLRPVTYSGQQQAFLIPGYGWDGRVDFSTATTLALKQSGSDVSGDATAEGTPDNGHLLMFNFWIRNGSSDCTVLLSEQLDVTEGQPGGGTYVTGRPIWNSASIRHDDGGTGAQNALRIGFKTYAEEGYMDSQV